MALKNDGLDFKYASAGPDAIAIEQFGAIWLYDVKTGAAHKVDIRIAGDLPQLRVRYENVGNRIRNAGHLALRSASGVRGARRNPDGACREGDIRNLTNTPGADERYPAWSPDGKSIAYFSDESGEVALYVKNQNGQGEAQKIDLGTPGSFFFFPTWSPDSKKIAYTDKRLNLWYVDLEKKTPVKVFHDRFTGEQQIFQAAWSPDSKWLAYTQQEVSHMRSVFLYSLETGKSERVTDAMSDSVSPVFDKERQVSLFSFEHGCWADEGYVDAELRPAGDEQRIYRGAAQGFAVAAGAVERRRRRSENRHGKNGCSEATSKAGEKEKEKARRSL